MADSNWTRTQYFSTQAAAGTTAAMASGMITLAAKSLKEGIDAGGWTVIASANSLSSYSLTGDVWAAWESIVMGEAWAVLSAPSGFADHLDKIGVKKSKDLYILIYMKDTYYLNIVYSLSPFNFSGGSLPTWGSDSWGHIYTANTSDPKYSSDGYTTIPFGTYQFTNETIVSSDGSFIFTHRGNSVAGDFSDSHIPRIVVSAMRVRDPRNGDLCPIVSFKSCTSSTATALSSTLSTGGLHLMDGSSSHRWRGIFWDEYSWKETRMAVMGLGYTYFSGSTPTSALISGNGASSPFAYRAMMLSCSPGARFYRGSLPDCYITYSNYLNNLDINTVYQYGLNNLTLLANTTIMGSNTTFQTLSPSMKFFTMNAPPKPGYIKTDTTTLTAETVTEDLIKKALRQAQEAQAILEAAKQIGVVTTTVETSVSSNAPVVLDPPPPVVPGQASNIDANATYRQILSGSLNIQGSGETEGVDLGYGSYIIDGVYLNHGETAYICLNTGDALTSYRMRPGYTNIIELPGEVGLDSDTLTESSYLQRWSVEWVQSTLPNPSLETDLKISLRTTPSFYISVVNVSSSNSPVALSVKIDRYNTIAATIYQEDPSL